MRGHVKRRAWGAVLLLVWGGVQGVGIAAKQRTIIFAIYWKGGDLFQSRCPGSFAGTLLGKFSIGLKPILQAKTTGRRPFGLTHLSTTTTTDRPETSAVTKQTSYRIIRPLTIFISIDRRYSRCIQRADGPFKREGGLQFITHLPLFLETNTDTEA